MSFITSLALLLSLQPSSAEQQLTISDSSSAVQCYACQSPEENLLPKLRPTYEMLLKQEVLDAAGLGALPVRPHCHRSLNASQLPTHACRRHPFCFKYSISLPNEGRNFVLRGCADRLFQYRAGRDEDELFGKLYEEKEESFCLPHDSRMYLVACACKTSFCNAAPAVLPALYPALLAACLPFLRRPS